MQFLIGYYVGCTQDVLCPFIPAVWKALEGRSYNVEKNDSVYEVSLIFLKAINVGQDAIFSQCTENRLYWASELVTLFPN